MDNSLIIDLYYGSEHGISPKSRIPAWDNWVKTNHNTKYFFDYKRLQEDWGATLNFMTEQLEFVDLEHKMEWLVAWS